MITLRTLILAASLSLAAPLASAQSIDRTEAGAMVGAINAERARHSAVPLTEDPRLDAIAEAHSLEMARSRFFAHESPSTGQPADRVTHAGLHWSAVAENIALNQSPAAAQQALLRSPGHHENMVDPVQRSVGIGIVRHGDQVWVTQLFATLNDAPASVAGPVAVVPSHPAAPVGPVEPDEPDDDDGEDADEDTDEAPAAAPVAPVAPAVPAAPSMSGLPWQGVPGLDQFLTGLGLTRQPARPASTTPSAPTTPSRAGRTAPATQVYTVQTPFGPVRVEVPSAVPSPTAAPTPAPARPRASRPAPAPRAPRVHRPAPPRGRVIEVDTLDV